MKKYLFIIVALMVVVPSIAYGQATIDPGASACFNMASFGLGTINGNYQYDGSTHNGFSEYVAFSGTGSGVSKLWVDVFWSVGQTPYGVNYFTMNGSPIASGYIDNGGGGGNTGVVTSTTCPAGPVIPNFGYLTFFGWF